MAKIPSYFTQESTQPETFSQLYGDMVETIGHDLVAETIRQGKPVQEDEIEAQAAIKSIFAAQNWDRLKDGYILFALSEIEHTGSWRDVRVGRRSVYNAVQDLFEEIYEREYAARKNGSQASNWRFLIGWTDKRGNHPGMIKIFEDNGYPLSTIIQFMSLGSKWREWVSDMRDIEREYYDQPEEMAKRLFELTTTVLEEKKSIPQIRARADELVTPPNGMPPPRIKAENTSYVMTDNNGGGLLVIPVRDTADVHLIESATKGLFDDSQGSVFAPRDPMTGGLGKMVISSLKAGQYQVTRSELDADAIAEATVEDQVQVIIPVTLEEIRLYGFMRATELKLIEYLGELGQQEITEMHIAGSVGDELHLQIKVPA